MTAMDIEPVPATTSLSVVPDWDPVVPTPRDSEPAEPVAPVEPPWWLGTVVPGSALAEQAELLARIRELELLVYQTRVELTSLRQHMHDVSRRADG